MMHRVPTIGFEPFKADQGGGAESKLNRMARSKIVNWGMTNRAVNTTWDHTSISDEREHIA